MSIFFEIKMLGYELRRDFLVDEREPFEDAREAVTGALAKVVDRAFQLRRRDAFQLHQPAPKPEWVGGLVVEELHRDRRHRRRRLRACARQLKSWLFVTH